MIHYNFKNKAKHHQVRYREEVLKLQEGDYPAVLTNEDALAGRIFYDGFGIADAASNRYPNFTQHKACFANMLRSEHIPFNFFIPLQKDLSFARNILNVFLGTKIQSVTQIVIEHAPDPNTALLDKTSFDVYVEYIHIDGGIGTLGIEVKYTEKGYPLKKGSTEYNAVHNFDSRYYQISNESGVFKPGVYSELLKNEYRQIWRNHLLGESMLLQNIINHFTSVILYPKGNTHFISVIPEYKNFLKPEYQNRLIGITYEDFIIHAKTLKEYSKYQNWLEYLEKRYLFSPI